VYTGTEPQLARELTQMFVRGMAKTEMTRFWQFMFDFCHEDYSCVLGWLLVGILIFLVVIVGLGFMMKRINDRNRG
jgi:uncharacterized membrane protein SpoIIM required for sporulation